MRKWVNISQAMKISQKRINIRAEKGFANAKTAQELQLDVKMISDIGMFA